MNSIRSVDLERGQAADTTYLQYRLPSLDQTVDGRRRLVRYLLGHPDAKTARLHDVSVDVWSMKDDVRKGLSRLARARETIASDDAVFSGTPCVRGTRIPAHDIAEMLANEYGIDAIRSA